MRTASAEWHCSDCDESYTTAELTVTPGYQPACPDCGHEVGRGVGPSSASEITEAIRELWRYVDTNDGKNGALAARSRLEGIYREQQEEIERRRQVAMDLVDSISGYRNALASLKDSQLTPEEAHWLFERRFDSRGPMPGNIVEKLRSISSTPAPGNDD